MIQKIYARMIRILIKNPNRSSPNKALTTEEKLQLICAKIEQNKLNQYIQDELLYKK